MWVFKPDDVIGEVGTWASPTETWNAVREKSTQRLREHNTRNLVPPWSITAIIVNSFDNASHNFVQETPSGLLANGRGSIGYFFVRVQSRCLSDFLKQFIVTSCDCAWALGVFFVVKSTWDKGN
jgi:hypothetical protein